MKAKPLVFIPTYNEKGNVERLAAEILAMGLGLDLLLLDDASPDGTGEAIDALAAAHKPVTAAHRHAKLGIGSAHLDGIAWAYDHGYERLVTMDCDFTHSPSYIPEFLREGESADVVVGSRHMARGRLEGWSLLRKGVTKAGHLMTRALLGLEADATGGFRHYRLDRVPRALFSLVRSRGYAFFFESLYLLKANDFSIREIPIVLPARTLGQSKMSLAQMARSVGRLFSLAASARVFPERYRLARR